MRKTRIFRAALLAAIMTAAHSAGASTIYSVSSTPNINCAGSPHGLWTNTYRTSNQACSQYYAVQEGSTLTTDGPTAKLLATAVNGAGIVATIDILFGGFADTYAHYKNGGTPDYNGSDNPVNWDFYSYIIEGTISFTNNDGFNTLLVGQTAVGVASPDKPVLQIGDGANDKSGGLGASAWLDIYSDGGGPDYTGGAHWDLNMSLDLLDDPQNQVPAPATLALFGLGLAGLGWSRRKKA